MDAQDPLAFARERFGLPNGLIYLDGNSLGPLPRHLPERLRTVIQEEWGRGLIGSWNDAGWIDLPGRLGDRIAELVGAEAGEIIVADSTSINLFKLLAGAVRLRPERRVIVTERSNFPTDLYVAEGLASLLGDSVALRFVDGEVTPESVRAAAGDDCAVVMLTQVDYRSGRLLDMAEITAAAHAAGALMLWDLAHSAGALPVELGVCDVDLAVGCGYKYLNGGPGAPAFLYVARRLQPHLPATLSGWLGHARPFDFDPDYRPAPGIRRQLCGTPAILSMAALDAALDVWEDVDRDGLRRKSQALGQLFIGLVEAHGPVDGLVLASPRDPDMRGSQVAWRHPEGFAVMQALIARGVVGDFRAPDILRFGFAALYLRYVDVWDAVAQLMEVLRTGGWDRPEFRRRGSVT
ncbi:MAG: kynureninase [Chloroflexi bacterium]|nr:kynureninase [Chloroflexota bacterium]